MWAFFRTAIAEGSEEAVGALARLIAAHYGYGIGDDPTEDSKQALTEIRANAMMQEPEAKARIDELVAGGMNAQMARSQVWQEMRDQAWI